MFDKLVLRGVSIDSINFGFNILKRTEPKLKYEQRDYSAYLDDILNRAESEAKSAGR